jgi:hypothetical protein
VKPNPNVVARSVGDELVLVHLQTNRFYSLNRTGARLWELLQANGDPERLRRQMLEEFDVDGTHLAVEIETIIRDLTREGLLIENDAQH